MVGIKKYMKESPWTFGGVKAWERMYGENDNIENCKPTWLIGKTYCQHVLNKSNYEDTADWEQTWLKTWRHLCQVMPHVLEINEYRLTHVAIFAGSVSNTGDNILPRATRMAIEYFLGITKPRKWYLVNARGKPSSQNIEQMNQGAGVIVGGGGLFYPANKHSQQIYSGWQWQVSSTQLLQINKPLLLFAIGWNAFRNQYSQFGGFVNLKYRDVFQASLTAMSNRQSWTGVGLREYYSLENINAQHPQFYPPRQLFYQPCATTLLAFIQPCLASKTLIDATSSSTQQKILSVNVAADRLANRFGNSTSVVLDSIIDWLRRASNVGWTIHLTMQDLHDTPLLKRISLKNDKHGFNYIVHKFPTDCTNKEHCWLEVIHYYRSVTVAASTRGHGIMIPFGLHTATISLITHEKVKSFVKDIGHPEWGVELTPSQRKHGSISLADELFQKLEYIDNNRHRVYQEIITAQKMLASTTAANVMHFALAMAKQQRQ